MSEKCPTVSIVVCVYNAEDYLRNCLDSVLAQTSRDWELVCVDDGSSDGSVAILNEYAQHDQRIRVFPRGKNFGLLSARKFGVSKVQGEYVMFLDNDDQLLPNAIKELPELAKKTGSDIIQFATDFDFSASLSEAERRAKSEHFSVRGKGTFEGGTAILAACFQQRLFTWNVWNKLYDAKLLRRAYDAIPDEFMIMPEDAYAMFHIGALAHRLTAVQTPYYYYRVSIGVSSGTRSETQCVREIQTVVHSISRIREFLESGGFLHLRSVFAAYCDFFTQHYIPFIIKGLKDPDGVERMASLGIKYATQISQGPDLAHKAYSKLLQQRDEARTLQIREVARLTSVGTAQYPIDPNRPEASVAADTYAITLISESGYFDRTWYLETYDDVAAAGMDPAEHYYRFGWREGRNPSVHFDTIWYLNTRPAVAEADICPLVHYLESALLEGEVPSCLAEMPGEEDFILLAESSLFDPEYYVRQFSGNCCVGHPIVHYLALGWKRGLAPSRLFKSNVYCAANPDVAQCGYAPLLHYLKYGQRENRRDLPDECRRIRESGLFDDEFYMTQYAPVLGGLDPLEHYLLNGWRLGYDPSERFSQNGYFRFYFCLSEMGFPALTHYVCHGKSEGRLSFARTSQAQWFFPKGFERKSFDARGDKVLVATHQLDHTGVPVLSRQIAALWPGQSAVVTPVSGPLMESCLKAGIPVVVDPAFFVTEDGCEPYRRQGFGFCIFNCVTLAWSFLKTYEKIPSVLWIHDNVDRTFFPEDMRLKLATLTNVRATSSVTTGYVRTYAPLVSFLPYPVFDRGVRTRTRVPEKIRFGIVASITPRKGQDVALRAFGKLDRKSKAYAGLQLVGDFTPDVTDEFSGELQRLAKEEGAVFRGVVKDAAAYHALYDDMDVLICPSREDPMPLVVLDAMMHGCPVIVSDHVGEKDFVENGVNGYVFKSEDVEELREVIEKMIARRTSYPAMSAAIRKTFEKNFDERTARKAIEKALASAKEYVGGCR